MSTQSISLLGHTFTCEHAGSTWRVHDEQRRPITTVTDPCRLTLAELSALAGHLEAGRAQAQRRRQQQMQFGERVAAAIAAHRDEIVTVGNWTGRLYSLPQRARFNWGKAVVRAELRRAELRRAPANAAPA